jgi:hypothetical protein
MARLCGCTGTPESGKPRKSWLYFRFCVKTYSSCKFSRCCPCSVSSRATCRHGSQIYFDLYPEKFRIFWVHVKILFHCFHVALALFKKLLSFRKRRLQLDVSHNEHQITDVISHATCVSTTRTTLVQRVISSVSRFGSFALTKLPPQESATLPHNTRMFLLFQGISHIASTASRSMIMRSYCVAIVQRSLHLNEVQSFFI